MAGVTETEFTVRVPNNADDKTFHVMKFNASYNIDFSAWQQVRMVRENNQKNFATQVTVEEPKFGAGSAFGKDQKEEARRKKLGIVSKKYRVEDQPWLMRIGGKGGKKFKGTKEGGVAENTTYYVFTHGKDGSVEAYPIADWYNFIPIQRYKTLDADEAEEKFAQRGKVLNKWAVMVHRKLKPQEEDVDDDEGDKKTKGKKEKELKISDMDDWEGDDDGLDTDSDKEKDDDDDDEGKKSKKGASKDTKKKNKKKKKGDEDDEAFEDSDDGDDEGREVDYMSDESSESEADLEKEAEVKGVDQDEGLLKMLDSESSSEDEDKKKDKDKDEDEEEEDGPKKKRKSKSRENSDDEGKKKKKGSAANSRAGTPTADMDKTEKAEKRKAMVANILDPNMEGPSAKKSRLETFGSSAGGGASVSGNEAISEEDVRRYLNRRPMTTIDLLKKFRSKRTGLENAQLVQLLANILKKINPHKQKVKGVTYLSLKETQ